MGIQIEIVLIAAMVAIGSHRFTDAAAGAAVGTGIVLACALSIDLVITRARQPKVSLQVSRGP